MTTFYPELQKRIRQSWLLKPELSPQRKQVLNKLKTAIRDSQETTHLVFICTHNSRRSHLAQLSCLAAAHWFGHDKVTTYSGGTEATAFHPNAVAAIKRAGFQVNSGIGDNPTYTVQPGPGGPATDCFSKVYDHPENPSTDFIAVMVCSDADENCPFVPGARHRISLPYDDPKMADHTPAAAATYDQRLDQIARELFWVFDAINE